MSVFRKTWVSSICIYCFANCFFPVNIIHINVHFYICMCTHTRTHIHTCANMAKVLAGFWTCFYWVSSEHVPCTEVMKTSLLWHQCSATLNRRCASARKIITNVCRNRMNQFWWTFLHLLKENKHHTFVHRQFACTALKCFCWKCAVISTGIFLLAENSCYWN